MFIVYHDDINERYIETYLFPAYDQADAAHRLWSLFINGDAKEPPVKYGFETVTDPNYGATVDFVSLMEKSVQNSINTSDDGVERKIAVFSNLYEALEQYQKANAAAKTQKQTPPADAAEQLNKSIEMEIDDDRQPQISSVSRLTTNVSKKTIEK
jgi:hypothetical protein